MIKIIKLHLRNLDKEYLVLCFPIIQVILVTCLLGSEFPVKGHAVPLGFFFLLSFYYQLHLRKDTSQQLLEPRDIKVAHKYPNSVSH